MTTLDRYLLKQFLPFFLVAICFSMLLFVLIDLFINLVRYLNFEVSLADIFMIKLLYLPKTLTFSLPVSLLFATAYILADLYSRNELTAIFASGVPFWRFSFSLLVFGIAISFFSFFFNDIVVIPTYKSKNELSRILLHEQRPHDRADIVVKARHGMLIYAVDYFDHSNEILNNLSIIEQDEKGNFVSLVRAPRAVWAGEHWHLVNAVIYEWDEGFLRIRDLEPTDIFREEPDTFRRNMVNVEELNFRDARLLVQDLKIAGLPFTHALTDYYHRFSFATVSFVVIILSISMGGRFKKNIMLMSLLSSIGIAVVFYVMQMVSMMFARLGYIHPLTGAWFPVFIFIGVGLVLLKTAKT